MVVETVILRRIRHCNICCVLEKYSSFSFSCFCIRTRHFLRTGFRNNVIFSSVSKLSTDWYLRTWREIYLLIHKQCRLGCQFFVWFVAIARWPTRFSVFLNPYWPPPTTVPTFLPSFLISFPIVITSVTDSWMLRFNILHSSQPGFLQPCNHNVFYKTSSVLYISTWHWFSSTAEISSISQAPLSFGCLRFALYFDLKILSPCCFKSTQSSLWNVAFTYLFRDNFPCSLPISLLSSHNLFPLWYISDLVIQFIIFFTSLYVQLA